LGGKHPAAETLIYEYLAAIVSANSVVSGLAIVELGQAVAKGEPQAEQTGDQDGEAGGH